ncbi:MAG: MFS transporter [Firmicutes bacterium]|nr:MFS transporter [Alicyclobacillaceae bacterium]MCL6497861.1 MFS transporter [Bacillota bacterium]
MAVDWSWLRWSQYQPAARRLMWVRFSRSVGQGMMTVNFALYLKALGWPAAHIGVLLTASGFSGAGLALVVGHLSDRYGRKPFLLLYEAITVAAGLAVMATALGWVLTAAAVGASFGRGQNGGAGPFGPAEQAWLAGTVPSQARAGLLSLNAALSFLGLGLGSLAAGAVPWLSPWLPGALAFRPLFGLVVLGSLFNLALLVPLREPPRPAPHRNAQGPAQRVHREENRNLMAMTLANAINGLSFGLTGPFMAYWFSVRFGASLGAIGSLMALSNFAMAGFNVVLGQVSRAVGVVRTVVWSSAANAALIFLLPLMPNFFWGAAVYFLRSLVSRGIMGARQTVSLSLVRDQRRGWAASLNTASVQVFSSVGPTVTGYLLDLGALDAPFWFSGLCQVVYFGLYRAFFAHLDQRFRLTPPSASG